MVIYIVREQEHEIWKDYNGDITEFHGWIKVSSKGRIYKIGGKTSSSKILNCTKTCQGYVMLHVSINGKSYTKPVHRLVAEMFCPNPDNKPYVDHINAVRNDNRAINLRWVTASENNQNPHYTMLLSKRSRMQLSDHNYLAEANKKKCLLKNIDGQELIFNSISDVNKFFHTKANLERHIRSGKYFVSKKSKLKGWKIILLDK